MPSPMMCPHCGRQYSIRACKDHLIPDHAFPHGTSNLCPGSKQVPRNAESDKRPLWKDLET